MHSVRKRNKRLEVFNQDTGEAVYTPPDFLRIDSRKPLCDLAKWLDHGVKPITAIMRFESECPVRKI